MSPTWIVRTVVVVALALPQSSAGDRIAECGSNRQVDQAESVSRIAVILAADRRGFSPCTEGAGQERSQEVRDLALLDRALASQQADIRRLAAQGLGRFSSPAMIARLVPLLNDQSAVVRMEAANALAQSVSGLRSDLRTDAPVTADQLATVRKALDTRLSVESDDGVAGVILASLGRTRLPDAAADMTNLDAIERTLVAGAIGTPARMIGAARGLESLARKTRNRQLRPEARQRLREMAAVGRAAQMLSPELQELRLMSMTALQVAGDTDTTTIVEALEDIDFQVRRVGAQMLSRTNTVLLAAFPKALADSSPHVRMEAVRSFARGMAADADCGPIVKATADADAMVALTAIDALARTCADMTTIVSGLGASADQLLTPEGRREWHRPARALHALARLVPDEATRRLAGSAQHPVWQVRATIATAAGLVNDQATLRTLARDRDPNVQTAVIEAMVRVKHPDLTRTAIAALSSADHQLVRAAAGALEGAASEAATTALFEALKRLTALGSDTSRDPRVAIVTRLAQMIGPARVGELADWTGDWDTAVRAAAVRAFTTAGVAVPDKPRQFRYPLQPTAAELAAALGAQEADIVLADGQRITLTLLPDQAPVTVARFVKRARAGDYNNLTFHRVVFNFVVQGLSPGANEYVGDYRFMRDETGLERHARGAVGISTRGYDTGDTQIFFDLIDVPRLNHDYTVFAHVKSGMQYVDAMLEGAQVSRVIIR